MDPTFGVFFMTKYDEAFKRRVVKEYLAGEGGARLISEKYEIGRSVLRRWVSAWQHHGDSGLRRKHEAYSAEFKLKVLQRMWRDELSFQQTSALFDLREAAGVSRWERQYHEGGLDASSLAGKAGPPRCPRPNRQHPQPRQFKTNAHVKICSRRTSICARRWRT